MTSMSPGDRANLDQALEGFLGVLQTFGIDRNDPVAMAHALATVRAISVIISHLPSEAMAASVVRGVLLGLTEAES